jgi:phage terminase large subunit
MKLHRKFQPLLSTESRYSILTGGRGSGKSFAIAAYLCTLTFEPNQKILFTRYTLTAAKVSIIPEFLEKIELLGFQNHFRVTNDSIINISTGSEIIFKGIKTSSGNQTANLKSLQGITTWVLDEAEELMSEEDFDKIDLSIREKDVQNRIILLLNPTTKEHFIYKRFFEGQVNEGFNGTREDVTYIHTTFKDNIPNLSEAFLNRIEQIRTKSPEKYQHVILGGWMDKAEGVIFDNWTMGDFPDIPYVFGLDFGFNPDPTALVRVGIEGDVIYLEELLYQTDLSTSQIENHLKKHATKDDLIVADHAEKRLINELYERDLNVMPCEKGKDSIKNGIGLLKDYRFVVKGDNLVKELNNYVWNDKKASVPVDNYNHLCDAFRYACIYSLRGKEFFVV